MIEYVDASCSLVSNARCGELAVLARDYFISPLNHFARDYLSTL